jgi:hypothetical protein
MACSYPNAACYYIAPFQKQARELIWANHRIQDFFRPKVDPRTGLTPQGYNLKEANQIFEELWDKYILKVNDSEMRIVFRNNSFIKLDGSDNYAAYRGVNPHAIGYDEFKDFHPKFHEGMDPNLATHNAPLLAIGTPPDGSENNAENFEALADYCKNDPDSFYQNKTTYANPYISRDFLEKKRLQLISSGKSDEWEREYMAKRIRSGQKTIFPTFEPPNEDTGVKHTRHVRPESELQSEVMKHYKDWERYYIFDPASASCFGGLYICFHRYDRRVRVLSDIYEKDKAKMKSTAIMDKAIEQLNDRGVIVPDVRMVYDYAATWFYNDIVYNENYEDVSLEPCEKDIKTKKDKISMIRDLLDMGVIKVGDNCTGLIHELTVYKTDDNNKILKEDDHLIDCLRYALNAEHYSLDEVPHETIDDGRRGYSLEEEIDGQSNVSGHV